MEGEEYKATTVQHALIDLTRRVDIVRGYPYRDAEYAVLGSELVPAAREIAGEVLAIVEVVASHYKSGDRQESPAEVVARVSGNEPSDGPAAIADFCAVGTSEVNERLERLDEIAESEDELVLFTAAMATLGSLRRLAIVLENTIAAHEGLTAALSTMDDVERALAIRRTYVGFRRAIRPSEWPTVEQVAPRLREAATLIAELFGRDIYSELRAADRIQLHRLQDRLLSWLGEEHRDPDRGRELWDDLATYVELLGQVNHRLELVEHDRAVIVDACNELGEDQSESGASIPERLFEVLESLFGRDDTVDALVDERVTARRHWRPVLQRLRVSLGVDVTESVALDDENDDGGESL